MIEKIPHEWRYHDSETKELYPWYTKPCLEWLLSLNLKGKRIFEYGVGASTLWYRKQGAFVSGVDSDGNWAALTSCGWIGDKDSYIQYITWFKSKFDMVVIDGSYRDECTKFALSMLKPSGYLIIDNYKQPSVEEHWPITEKLIEGMDITHYKEPDHYDWQTIVVKNYDKTHYPFR